LLFCRRGFAKGTAAHKEGDPDHFRARGRDDVRSACERLGKLTDAQWRDAFRAGGFEPSVAERFIARLKVKIEEGLKLAE